MKNYFLLGYLRRYWPILILLAVAWLLPTSNSAFAMLGMVVYVPAAALTVVATALLMRHLVNRKTTDDYRAKGQLKLDWASLPANQKVWVFKIELWVWILALAIVCAAILS